jgi:enoyl-CoA hydratase/carnithine racemase
MAAQAAKQAVEEGLELALDQALGRDYAGIRAFVRSHDGAEARAALHERRVPVWTGR